MRLLQSGRRILILGQENLETRDRCELADSLGEAIRKAREAAGISQRALADQVGLPAAQTLSEIELGRREVRSSELVRLARALYTDVDTLLGLNEARPAGGVLWRRAEPAADRRRERQLLDRAARYAQLEQWCGAEAPRVLPEFQLNFASAAAADSTRLAEDVRRAMDLGSIPAAALLRTLEDCYGVKVFWEQLTEAHDGDCSAACARGEFGSAILIDASEAPWRRNFSLAHELFHLLTWNSVPVREAESDQTRPERIERLADNFAGSLLLPADSLTDRFTARAQDGKITYGELVRMARDFGVSTQALLIRLRDLRHIKATDVARLLKDETFRRVDEASWVDRNVPAVPFSARYVELAYAAFQRGIIGVSMLAKYLEKPIADLELPETKVEDAAEAALTVV